MLPYACLPLLDPSRSLFPLMGILMYGSSCETAVATAGYILARGWSESKTHRLGTWLGMFPKQALIHFLVGLWSSHWSARLELTRRRPRPGYFHLTFYFTSSFIFFSYPEASHQNEAYCGRYLLWSRPRTTTTLLLLFDKRSLNTLHKNPVSCSFCKHVYTTYGVQTQIQLLAMRGVANASRVWTNVHKIERGMRPVPIADSKILHISMPSLLQEIYFVRTLHTYLGPLENY